MDRSFKGKLAKKMAKGEHFHLAMKHAMTTKTENAKKRATKMARAKATIQLKVLQEEQKPETPNQPKHQKPEQRRQKLSYKLQPKREESHPQRTPRPNQLKTRTKKLRAPKP